MANLLALPACPVNLGTCFPEIKPFYWQTIKVGQWLQLKLKCSQVLYIVCVVDNSLSCADGPTLTVHLGSPRRPITIRREDIRRLKRYWDNHPGKRPMN